MNKVLNAKNILFWSLLIANLTMLSYILVIAYFNTIMVDDFCFISTYKKYGIIGNIKHYYLTWQARFAPFLFTNLIIKLYEFSNSAIPYTIFISSLFIYSFYLLISQFFGDISKALKVNLATFLFLFMLLVSYKISTFFWINASTMYYGGLAFATLNFALLLDKKVHIIRYCVLFISSFYLASSAEHFSAIIIMLLSCYLLYLIYNSIKNNVSIFNNAATKKTLFSLGICIVTFVLMITAPGNGVRRTFVPESSLGSSFSIALDSFKLILFGIMRDRYKFFLIESLLFFYIGTLVPKPWINYKTLLISALIFLLFIYICQIPMAYALSGIGPYRALNHVSFYFVLYNAFFFANMGSLMNIPAKISSTGAILASVLFLLVSIQRITTKIPATVAYAKSERARIAHLKALETKGQNGLVELTALKSSGDNILKYTEISKHENNWQNVCICNALELNFNIKLKAPQKNK